MGKPKKAFELVQTTPGFWEWREVDKWKAWWQRWGKPLALFYGGALMLLIAYVWLYMTFAK